VRHGWLISDPFGQIRIVRARHGQGPGSRWRPLSEAYAEFSLDRWLEQNSWLLGEIAGGLGPVAGGWLDAEVAKEVAKKAIREAFQRRELVAFRLPNAAGGGVAGGAGPIEVEEPSPPDEPTPEAPLPPTNFAVKWVDEIGSPIDGLEVVFEISGKPEKGATGGDGVARHTDPQGSSFAFARAVSLDAVRQAVKPRWDTIREGDLVTQADALVFKLRGDVDTIQLESEEPRTISVHPYVARHRLIGGYFDTSKSFILPHGLAGIRAIVAEYDTDPEAKLLLVGHTDTAGKPDYNDPLSLERAEALKDYLTDNVDGWLKWYGQVPSEKRWGAKEDQLMIGSLDDAPTRPPGEAPVRWFQRTRGLEVDGIAGPKTRRALVTEYMALDDTSLPAGIEPIVHGCGENFPVEETGDSVAEPDNRRVEAFFFDGELGVQPPPPGSNSGPGSPEYPEWCKRTGKTDDHVAQEGPQLLALRLHDAKREPMPGAVAQVTAAGPPTPQEADDRGFIFVLLPLVCPVTIRVEYGPQGTTAPFPLKCEVVADCQSGDQANQDRNRLHNLGYTLDLDFEMAAKQFQIDYDVDLDDEGQPAGLDGEGLPAASHDLLAQIFGDRDCDASVSS
jgi:hypothetical protein